MKKTMFITSVIMVVVMAIALTTSSLAWFSAAGEVTVGTNNITISAQANASQGLLISKTNTSGAYSTSNITLTATSTGMKPMVPLADSNAAADLVAALGDDSFIGNTTKYDGALKWAGAAYTTGFFSDDLYVANSGDQDVHIAASINITEAHGATLYIAVLAQKEDDSWELIALKSSDYQSSAYVVPSAIMTCIDEDAFEEDELVSAASTSISVSALANTSETLDARTGNATWGGEKHFKVVAWYSANLTNDNSGAYDETNNDTGSTCIFGVTFSIPAADQLD